MEIQGLSQASAAFLSSWQALRQNGAIPHTARFLDCGPSLMMKDALILESCPPMQTVRFMGTALVRTWLQDLTGNDFLLAVEPDCKKDAQRHFAVAASHPTGFAAGTTGSTIEGRTVAFELLILPLAVDQGKPRRCVTHVSMGPIGANDRVRALHWQREPLWFDLGFGLPA